VWHITERAFELWQFSRGCSVVYSSIRTFKNDLAKHQPQWLVLVPRVMEKIAMGVQDKFATSSATIRTLVKFFTAIGTLRATHVKISNGLCVGDEPPHALQKLASRSIAAVLNPIHAVGTKLVWSKVRDGFGGKCKTIICGGSALAGSLEQFYEVVGMNICVGYGLTECSPIISYRRSDANLVTAGCAGKPALDTEVVIVDPDSMMNGSERRIQPHGQPGVVMARGPQVTKGYYKNPQATAKSIDANGWFDTGDLGRINPATGDLILTGRAKDTIVLSNGENVEPQPIEDAILGELPNLVEQVMLTGQDGRRLIAIVVLKPSELVNTGYLDKAVGDQLQAANEKVNDPKCSEEDCAGDTATLHQASDALRQNKALQDFLVESLKRATSNFRAWEQVNDVYVTLEPFAMANGQLTQSYKVKRDVVLNRYAEYLPK
jgi:long-chain acyl-CoA synthetase